MIDVEYKAERTPSKMHLSDASVRGLMGPIGSGKSVACCWELLRRAQSMKPMHDGIRRSRWAIVRNTYRELQDTTIRTWEDWFPKSIGHWSESNLTHTIKLGDMEAQFIFRALDRPDDVKKLLSWELTGGWINEAREVPYSIIKMLRGRLGRYPSRRDIGTYWYGLIMDTNPPDDDHWWYRIFEEERPPNWQLFRQPSALSEDAENLQNLQPDYYAQMMEGADQEWINVYVHGRYGFLVEGKVVYPEYQDDIHASREELKPDPDLTLYVGLDFGRTPAALFAQRKPDGQWQVLDEMVTEDMSAVIFAKDLRRKLNTTFRDCMELEIWGDPSGDYPGEQVEETAIDILRANNIPALPCDTNDFTLRREAVVSQLTKLTPTGKPGFVISPKAKMFRRGMSGGYHYRRLQVSGDTRYHEKPLKNIYSHICEAGQYLFLGAGEGDALVSRPIPHRVHHSRRQFGRGSRRFQ